MTWRTSAAELPEARQAGRTRVDGQAGTGGESGAGSGGEAAGGTGGVDDRCGGVLCGACGATFLLTIETADHQTADVQVDGLESLSGFPEAGCQTRLGTTSCTTYLPAGDHEVVISAPGYVTQVVSFRATVLEVPPGSCCFCGGVNPDQLRVTLQPDDGDLDGGAPDDDGGA